MKTLIIAAHPDIAHSRVNKSWLNAAKKDGNFVIHEIYKEYPNWQIDVKKEQGLLEKFECAVFEFPLYWYSYPPLLKKYFDDVFAYGWAYGSKGKALNGKKFALAVSVGDDKHEYSKDGHIGFSIEEVITPFKSAVNFVGAKLLPSFFAFGFSVNPSDELVENSTKEYMKFLRDLSFS